MKRNALILAALFLVVCATLPTLADAGQKLYPGELGIVTNGAARAIVSGALFNADTVIGTMLADLPLLRQNPANPLSFGWVQVLDQNANASADVTVVLWSVFRLDGAFVAYTSPAQSTFASSVNPQTLNFGPLPTTSLSHAYYAVIIPPPFTGNQSGVISYSLAD